MGKDKVLLYAYVNNNVGDDLFITLLCRRYPDSDFYVSRRARQSKTLAGLPNLKPSWRVLLLCKLMGLACKLTDAGIPSGLLLGISALACKRYPTAVFITGGAFRQEKSVWAGQLARDKARTKAAGNAYYIIGANFGPYASERFRHDYEQYFRTVTDVCFRDGYSKAQFPALDNVRWAPDVVFTCPAVSRTPRPQALISVIHCAFAMRPPELQAVCAAYEEKIAEMAAQLMQRGYEVQLVAFCKEEEDDVAARRIAGTLREGGNARVSVLCYDGDLDAILDAFALSSLVIATRFHAMVLGWRYGKPTMPICYQSKMTHVLEDVPFWKGYEIADIGQVDASGAVETLLMQPSPDCSALSAAAEAQFAALDRRLGKHEAGRSDTGTSEQRI